MTRRLALLIALAVVATAATAVVLVASERAREAEPKADAPAPANLAMLVVDVGGDRLPVVIGTTGSGRGGALIVPPEVVLTVPGQGESTAGQALALPPRQATTALANLLGVWIDDHAAIDVAGLGALADSAGGVELGGDTVDGAELVGFLEDSGTGAVTALQVALEALLAAEVSWDGPELSGAERPERVARALASASGARVVELPTEQVADGVIRTSPEQVAKALAEAFGGPAEPAVPVIVLNGNGVPGVGELVAERILPGGFRVAVSQNASTFDHLETLVVVGSPDDVGLGERVRDLLGVGSVSVSVGSGIAPVTVVVGKDFIG